MPKAELPRFIVYQPNEKEFHICLEAGRQYLCWCSTYAPTLDVAFPREVTRIDDMPLKARPKKQIFDEGTYTVPKAKTKEQVEEKLLETIRDKSFSFSLNGTALKGRFLIKLARGAMVIQKYKDKYAKEEDVLSGDLIRTINTMVPDYDESKVDLTAVRKAKRRKPYKPVETAKDVENIEEEKKQAELPIEEITADMQIGGADYHFAFYTADNEPEICVVTSANDEVLVLKKEQEEWLIVPSASKKVLKNEYAFIAHAKALYGQA